MMKEKQLIFSIYFIIFLKLSKHETKERSPNFNNEILNKTGKD